MFTTLISASQLNAQLPATVVIDCRSDLMKPAAGRAAYTEAHIPGAVYADLETDLSGPKSSATGRHPLPDPNILAQTFGSWGIGFDAHTKSKGETAAEIQVVAYDADTGMYAARAWWLLRWLGYRAVAVLDGGFKSWVQSGLPTSIASPAVKPAKFVAKVDASRVTSTADVASRLNAKDWRLIDARAPERFRGDVEPIDPVAGHIPGAVNHPFAANMDGGQLLPPEKLRDQFARSLAGIDPAHSAMMCGSGVTACHNLLALEVAGMPGAKLYAGSWSEWIRDGSRPIAKG